MAQPDRKGGGGLSLRTLAIASAASLVAAMVTSRLFPPGTIYTAALTPVIVAAVSEVLNRPVDHVSQIRRQRRTVVMEPARVPTFTPDEPVTADLDAPEPTFEGANGDAPLRLRDRNRMLHPKVWIATGLIAFAIAAAVLTLPELLFGGSVSTTHRTTLFGGGSSGSTQTHTTTTPTQTQTVTQTTTTVTQTSTTPTQTTTTPTQTTPTDTTTTPTQTTPTDTTTSTSPAPSGVVPPQP